MYRSSSTCLRTFCTLLQGQPPLYRRPRDWISGRLGLKWPHPSDPARYYTYSSYTYTDTTITQMYIYILLFSLYTYLYTHVDHKLPRIWWLLYSPTTLRHRLPPSLSHLRRGGAVPTGTGCHRGTDQWWWAYTEYLWWHRTSPLHTPQSSSFQQYPNYSTYGIWAM